MAIVLMVVTAAAIILFVRYGLITGLTHLSGALSWSAKARGQATGLATSSPELVTLVAAGLAGVWEAGLWNIAASNIINFVLMLTAAARYGQLRELANKRFADEIGFAAAAVALPLLLMAFELDTAPVVVPILFGFFLLYRVVDKRLNPGDGKEARVTPSGNLRRGVVLLVVALISIAALGIFLGDATEEVVRQTGLHPAAAGWLLGLITSLPELITFFAVYGAAKREGRANDLDDTQEALDNLTASNVANAGLVYPAGLGIYLLVMSTGGL